MSKNYIFSILLLVSTAVTAQAEPNKVKIDPDEITVSGISAGAQMAHQLHIAFPEIFSGAGLIATGPFGCANGSLATAMGRCMGSVKSELPLSDFIDNIRQASTENKLGKTALLADDRVWIFHGALDSVVAPELSQAAANIYTTFMPAKQLLHIQNVKAAHTFPTLGMGSDCEKVEPPFIGNCNYDAAGELLQHLYGELIPAAVIEPANLIHAELPGGQAAGLLDSAYLYLPQACKGADVACKTHLVLHGCGQSSAQIDRVFIQQSGYLPWAESNNIILAFPQVAPAAANPLACWDWWGYTGADYRWRNGAQMQVLVDWLQQLSNH